MRSCRPRIDVQLKVVAGEDLGVQGLRRERRRWLLRRRQHRGDVSQRCHVDSVVFRVLLGESFEVRAAGRGLVVEAVEVGRDAQAFDCLFYVMSVASPLLSSGMASHFK
jgi:hypothetical protein